MPEYKRFFRIAEITIQVTSELPITESTFSHELDLFRVDGPGDDIVTIHHRFELPNLHELALGREAYRNPPWVIYQQPDGWAYLGLATRAKGEHVYLFASFNPDHSRGFIYRESDEIWKDGDVRSLTLFPSDQILIARLLADRNGCYLHSAGAILNQSGVLFVGHSEAGKSTMTRLLMAAGAQGGSQVSSPSSPAVSVSWGSTGPNDASGQSLQVEILCDDRNIVRCWEDGWRVHGTWSHGDVKLVSPASAPLRAICFLQQAGENSVTPLTDRRLVMHRLLGCVIKPLVSSDWWNRTLDVLDRLAREVPCYLLRFDQSGGIVKELRRLVSADGT